MKKIMLIVDDQETNRGLLSAIFEDEYTVKEAEDGSTALSILKYHGAETAIVLLDLMMPDMDGFEVLDKIRQNAELQSVPVIVVSGQTEREASLKAIRCGAADFVTKPIDPDWLRIKVEAAVSRAENAEKLRYQAERDELTGLYNRAAFFEKAAEQIALHEPGYYIMTGFDIDNFKVINDQYGNEKGDDILKQVAAIFQREFEQVGGIAGRLSGDNFANLFPTSLLHTGELEKIVNAVSVLDGSIPPLTFSIGRYIVEDLSLSASAMYDRADLAKMSVKGRYDINIAWYDESMRARLIQEQEIINQMKPALQSGQFGVWLQPQYNYATHILVGAEALVRWRHPEKGIVPPDDFIPVFERNGFIYEMDKYVWEETCKLLRRWIDEGLSPLPLAVNISRYDLLQENFIETITGLVKKYDLTLDLFHVEITESAFSKDTGRIICVVRKLIEYGFNVEIDDFGSGYSSLNTLKDVPAQVLKLDMRFLENSEDSDRGGNVLESVVRMAKWLGMVVVAEGVESIEQADYLISIGCVYMQGYLFARPMPTDEYETLFRGADREEKPLALQTVKNLDNNAFWDPESMDTLIFNSYVGAANIEEHRGDAIEMLRVSEKFVQMLGSDCMTMQDILKLDWARHFEEKSLTAYRAAVKRAIETGDEATIECVFTDLPGCPKKVYLRNTIRVIATTGDRHLVYCLNENITEQRAVEEKERASSGQLQAIMDNINGSVTAAVVRDGMPEFLFVNEQFYAMHGYTKEQFEAEIGNTPSHIHPADRERLMDSIRQANADGKPFSVIYRVLRRDGEVRWLQSNIAIINLPDIEERVQLSVSNDITELRRAERKEHEVSEQLQAILAALNSGVTGVVLTEDGLHYAFANDMYYSMLGYTKEQFEAEVGNGLDLIHPEDRARIDAEIAELIKTGGSTVFEYRVIKRDGETAYFRVNASMLSIDEGGESVSLGVSNDVTDMVRAQQQINALSERMQAILENVENGITAMEAGNLEKGLLFANNRFYEMHGYTREQYEAEVGFIADLVHPEDRQRVLETAASLNKTGMVKTVEHRIIRRDGEVRWLRTSISVRDLADVERPVQFAVYSDITEERSAYARLRLLLDSIPGGVASYVASPNGIRLNYFNDAYCDIFGYTRAEYEQLSATNVTSLTFEEDLPKLMEGVQALIQHDKPIDFTYRVHTKNGGYKWVNMQGSVAERRGDICLLNGVLYDVTERIEAENALRMSEEQFRIAADIGGKSVARYDIKTGVYHHTSKLLLDKGFGNRIENVPQAMIDGGVIAPESVSEYLAFYDKLRRGESPCSVDIAVSVGNGVRRWFREDANVMTDGGGEPAQAIIVFSDITELREKETVFRKWQQSLTQRPEETYMLFRCNLSKNGSFDSAEGKLLWATLEPGAYSFNDRTQQYAEQCVHEDDRAEYFAFMNSDTLLANYYRGVHTKALEYRETMPDGSTRWLRLTVELVEYPNSTDVEAFLLYENIDADKRKELHTKELAQTDPLTGILNRTSFSLEMERVIAEHTLTASLAFLILDIDAFKSINDNLGHAMGDQVLKDTADTLRTILRHGDLLGKLGGDEFLICMRDVFDEEAIERKAEQIRSLLHKSLSLEVTTSASIGIAVFPRDGRDFETLYRKADAALYHVKNHGKNNYAFFDESMSGQYLES